MKIIIIMIIIIIVLVITLLGHVLEAIYTVSKRNHKSFECYITAIP